MSLDRRFGRGGRALPSIVRSNRLSRFIALSGVAGLLAATVTVLAEVMRVTGDPVELYALAVATIGTATLFARYVRPKTALAGSIAILVLGLSIYLAVADIGFQPRSILADLSKFATGMSILGIRATTVWVFAVAPAPIFLTWYLALRHRYGSSALVGSVTVGFFVLTGDATPSVTLSAVVAAAVAVGVGDLERDGRVAPTLQYLTPLVALMIVTPLFISVVPSGAAPVPLGTGPGESVEPAGERTISGAVVEPGSELEVLGSVTLSTDVQFTVRAEEGRYWRTGSYDRYTGDGWIKTRDPPETNAPDPDAAPTARITQTYRAETDVSTTPAAWRPTEAESESVEIDVDDDGTLRSDRPLTADETYTVTSVAPDPSPEELRTANADYPPEVREHYTQLPSDVPDRVPEVTETILADANADDPYTASVTIEEFLRTNKEYSLDVQRPSGDVADAFLFEMDAGYCTYFATTMVTMLRSQDVPARMAVGYNTGQQVDEDEWVVRGANAHAWVEVYFPDIGWVRFDPTPPTELRDRQATALENVRVLSQELDEQAFDTRESSTVPPEGVNASTENGTEANDDLAYPELLDNENASQGLDSPQAPGTDDPERGAGDAAEPTDRLESPISGLEAVVLLAIGGLALVAAWRSPSLRWLSTRFRVRYLSRTDPSVDVERAFERMLSLLERRYRPRYRGETLREYLDAIDAAPDARRVLLVRERARYLGERSESGAAEVVRLVEKLSRSR